MNYFMLAVSILMALMILPHPIKMIRTKSSKDQSIIGIWGVDAGMACWLWYGLHINDMTIIVANAIFVLVQSTYGLVAMYYRANPGYLRETKISS